MIATIYDFLTTMTIKPLILIQLAVDKCLELLSNQTIILTLSVCLFVYVVHECLYYWPLWLVRKCPDEKNILRSAKTIGHCGCREDGIPENSIAAFKHAIFHEMDAFELDVWITQDLELVIFHDDTLDRMTGQSGCIGDMLYADLPSLRVDIPGQCEKIGMYPLEECTKIPKLSDVLDILPLDKAMVIEIKQDSMESIKRVHDLVTTKRKKSQIFWFSLEEKVNQMLRDFDPEIPNIVSVENFLKHIVYYYLGLMPFTEIPEHVYGITMEEISLEKLREERAIANVPDFIKRIFAFFLRGQPPYILLCPKLFAHFRRRGIPIWFLNVQNEEELNIAIRAGATTVLTDRVEWLNETMKRRRVKLKELYE